MRGGDDNYHDSTATCSYHDDNDFRRSHDGIASATVTSDARWNLIL